MRNTAISYIVAKYSTVIINILLNAILSRILEPDDYGVIAMVTVLISFFTVVSDLGIGNGVIQNKELDKSDINNIFVISIIWSLIIGTFFWCMAEPIAIFYGDDRLSSIIRCLSVSVSMSAANVIPNAIIMKQKMFNIAAKRMIFATTGGGIVAIIVACKGGGYYALVCQSIVTIIIQFWCNMKSSKLKIAFGINFDGIKKIFHYSFFQFAYSLILNISQNLDNFLTGKFMGSEELAYYNKSYLLMRYPIDYIPHAVSPIIHPLLAEHQNDKEYLYNKYLELVKLLSILGVFISVACYWNAEEIILLLFGNKWTNSIKIFQVFSMGIWVQLMNAIAGSLYLSSNNTKAMFYSGVLHMPLSILAIAIGIKMKNIYLLAILLVISWGIKFFVESYWLVKKSMHQKLGLFFVVFMPELIYLLAVNIVVFLNAKYMKGFAAFISKNVIITIVYIFWLILCKQRKYIDCLFKKGP